MDQYFEWNTDKNEYNIEKHGINFFDAIKLFSEEHMSYLSPRNNEERMVGIGRVDGRTIAITYTMRASNIRIISARIARRKERMLYMQWPKEEKSDE